VRGTGIFNVQYSIFKRLKIGNWNLEIPTLCVGLMERFANMTIESHTYKANMNDE